MSSQASQPLTDFGPNEWLVEELYQKYLNDRNSVDKAWWNFFADYKPAESAGSKSGGAAKAQNEKKTPADQAAPKKDSKDTKSKKAPASSEDEDDVKRERLRGAPARTATNMESSLELPTATSVRAVPVKLLFDNRIVINNHLRRARGGKVSFTHIIGYAMVKALAAMPEMNHSYVEVDGKPGVAKPEHVNFGLAIDLQKKDGSRQLVVPSIKSAENMDFAEFWGGYEDLVRKARNNKLGIPDFQGTTISLTNPGGIGTVHSVPRLMPGQGTILGVGAMEYPAEFQGASQDTLSELGISKVMTLTSTYDHRIIQGAQSGEFLRRIHQLLLGEDGFYDEIFNALRIPYEPVRWVQDIHVNPATQLDKTARVQELIHAYRVRGHLMADTNPLKHEQRKHPDLDVLEHGLTLWDLDREFPTGGFGGKQVMPLRDVLGVLRDTYCRTVGIEYMHIQSPEEREWIQSHVEREHEKVDRDEQLRILRRLNNAEAFETFLQTKYVGQKRFSLEGGESLIPLLDGVLTRAAKAGLDETVIGMAHRGRLNVLGNICGKSYGQIFGEFEGNLDPRSSHGSGDVKYHLGTEGVFETYDGEKIDIHLAANPSHLETVNPVLEGIVRAKQDVLDKGPHGFTVLPLLIHGDAAFAGQGVVAETLNLSQLRGYRTGGTVHVVLNNQVGFTTTPDDSRSSVYATDVARMVQAPIFHVNGDDPEAVVRVAELAFAYRQAFNKDVVIDLVCYRRRGHNEGDNPAFTQPLMYDVIDSKRSTRKLYTEALVGRGDITMEEAEQALRDFQNELERAFKETREVEKKPIEPGSVVRPEVFTESHLDHTKVESAISGETVKRVIDTQVNLPEDFTAHPRLAPQLTRRAQMVEKDTIDWATGELLAFGSLLLDEHSVRLIGQDSRRGTFTQRHATIMNRETGEPHTPLKQFDKGTTKFHVHDSLLSEYAALGFEYGYSLVRPEALVMWEAQFGDFVNGAQSIIDEYISSGEQKWGQRSSVTLLLPHGYEGQGPDHSSARIERFLQQCAQENMTVANPSTPASYFHLLRWQAKSPLERPLVVFTPKSLLRNKAAVSTTADFTNGYFEPLIVDDSIEPDQVRRVVLCSGKIYYDLDAARKASGDKHTAIIRTERLYPLPIEEIREQLKAFPNAGEVLWVQEEPANMGPWPFVALVFSEQLDRPFTRISRPASSAPAAGSAKRHEAEQRALVDTVFPPAE
ncbi:multifunctional oxoglutarate decarboxylase/oxoglutarate dehydrogenase thiamine pyrophosphate-binding subunit/dihydrolipoyllysine-residue succinyltransferase subunit [Nocardiopsis kunsanensis]|uniref:multifunctional oxoglutarate decarboxylase/oxoglutarate dehydrogenase thiamine pyrophosphate-binding subunit/dihydrolipoyllysine-residue succinyltransferase subunit n=1 Tax=Nocardiopsis kunsanensis TaxID=141693 RepID=UPI0005935A54|nr:multifunctional oxoglutarate decarboxylase/oxoglutarate dehydrogenase thiamine pyrophosphate-binding subunit/dihydrolipoyllysine-residue succinyltransferase subunit [Nocardiopsis kunsanensis]